MVEPYIWKNMLGQGMSSPMFGVKIGICENQQRVYIYILCYNINTPIYPHQLQCLKTPICAGFCPSTTGPGVRLVDAKPEVRWPAWKRQRLAKLSENLELSSVFVLSTVQYPEVSTDVWSYMVHTVHTFQQYVYMGNTWLCTYIILHVYLQI